MRRLFKIILISCVLIFATLAFAYSDTVRASTIGFSDYRQIEPKLYVSSSIELNKDNQILTLLQDAKSRITQHLIDVTATPTIIAVNGSREAEQFKLNGAPGKVLIAPWDNYLILDLERANLDVVAHEFVHAEIAERLGYIQRMRKMPTWLDEGIALQIDYRPRYQQPGEISNEEFERITRLNSPKSFWNGSREHIITNYQSAKAAVERSVLPIIEEHGLEYILDEIKNGKSVTELTNTNQK